MIFLAARSLGDEIELLYQHGDQHINHIVSRTVLGVGFPEATDYGQTNYAYLCVAAERVWFSDIDDSLPPERQYWIIDEAEATITSEIYAHAIRLKDKYLASTVFCPNSPIALVDGLKRLEGLTHYPEEPAQMLRERYPSFVSTLYKAGVREMKVDIEEARKDINRMLDDELVYPGTGGLPIFGPATTNNALRRLITLTSGVNFITDLADQGIQRSESKHIVPVWLAANGLDRSMAVWRTRTNKVHQWTGSAHSGY